MISVLDLTTGTPLDFEIAIHTFAQGDDLVYGRCRWSADGRSILFVGVDEAGASAIFSQPFVPGRDTSGDRIRLTAPSTFYSTESMGLSPDGSYLAVSAMYNRRSLMMAEKFKLADWDCGSLFVDSLPDHGNLILIWPALLAGR